MQGDNTILVVDRDTKTRDLVSAFLTYRGYVTRVVGDGVLNFDAIDRNAVNLVIADAASIPDVAVIYQCLEAHPLLFFIVYGDMASGGGNAFGEAVLTLPKPLKLDELESLVIRAREMQALKTYESSAHSNDRHKIFVAAGMVGSSAPMKELYDTITKVAASNATILIQGESGTGKELAARAIHLLSDRNGQKFVPVNCAAIPDDLLESELFGHVKGSFTGAYANRVGRFELADKGTLFLDEIGDMKANLQVKLLRVLQNREFEPVGASKSQRTDVRIIAATNKDLEQLVLNRDFREDLYYRLSVIPLRIPPLRERKDDIPLLVHTFLKRFNSDRHQTVKGLSRDALDILCNYDWPGNVRELENLVERLVILKGSGLIAPDDLPEKYLVRKEAVEQGRSMAASAPLSDLPEGGVCLNSAVEEFENNLIMQALVRSGGNKKEAAILLNLKRTTLIEKLKKKNLAFTED